MSTSYQRATLAMHSYVPDLLPQDAPEDAWNSVSNISFFDGYAHRASGDTPIMSGHLTEPRTMVYIATGGVSYWVYAGDDGIFAFDGALHWDITPVGWVLPPDGIWTATAIGGLAVINCSTIDPYYWDGLTANPCLILPGWPPAGRCLAMRTHKNFLFAIGMISENGARVRWSDASEAGQIPQEWDPLPSNLAGFQDLDPMYSPALDGMTLRDTMVIYKGVSVWGFDFIGGQFVFNIRKLFAERGIVSSNAVCRGLNDEHLFIGYDGDVYLTDGVNVKSVLDGRAQQTFYRDFSSDPAAIFAAVTLPRLKLAALFYPDASSETINQALIYDFASGDIGQRQTPNIYCAAAGSELLDPGTINEWDGDVAAWDTDRTTWNVVVSAQTRSDVIIGGEFGFASLTGDSDTFLDGPVDALLLKQGLGFGDVQQQKLFARCWPKMTGETGDVVVFRFGGQEITGGPIDWGPQTDYVIGSDLAIDIFQRGRWMAIQVQSVGGSAWRLGSLDIEYRGAGNW